MLTEQKILERLNELSSKLIKGISVQFIGNIEKVYYSSSITEMDEFLLYHLQNRPYKGQKNLLLQYEVILKNLGLLEIRGERGCAEGLTKDLGDKLRTTQQKIIALNAEEKAQLEQVERATQKACYQDKVDSILRRLTTVAHHEPSKAFFAQSQSSRPLEFIYIQLGIRTSKALLDSDISEQATKKAFQWHKDNSAEPYSEQVFALLSKAITSAVLQGSENDSIFATADDAFNAGQGLVLKMPSVILSQINERELTASDIIALLRPEFILENKSSFTLSSSH